MAPCGGLISCPRTASLLDVCIARRFQSSSFLRTLALSWFESAPVSAFLGNSATTFEPSSRVPSLRRIIRTPQGATTRAAVLQLLRVAPASPGHSRFHGESRSSLVGCRV